VIVDYISGTMYIWEFTMHVARGRRKKRILGTELYSKVFDSDYIL